MLTGREGIRTSPRWGTGNLSRLRSERTPDSMILETKRMTKYSIKRANNTSLSDISNLFRPISWNPSNQLTSIIDIIKDRLIRLEIEHNQDKWITENIEDTTIVSTRRVVTDSRHPTDIDTDTKSIIIYILSKTTMMKVTIRAITITETGTATIGDRGTGSIRRM